MNYGLSEFCRETITAALVCFPEIEQAIIFGSRARGNFKNGSDVDIAIKGAGIDARTVVRLSAVLNQELPLPYQFDIVDYEHLDHAHLRKQIDEHGKVFYQSSISLSKVAENPANYHA